MAKKLILAAVMPLLLALLLSGLSAQPVEAAPDADFVCKIRASGGDYTNLSNWESAIESNLTAASSMVFTVSDTVTYDSATDDGDTVTFTGGGTGTLKHINTDNKAYIVSCTGTINTGTVTCDTSSHTFTISDAGEQIRLAIAECYNDWPSGLGDSLTISGWTTDSSHHVKVYTPGGERHDGMMKSGADYAGFTLVGSGTKISISARYTEIDGIALDSTVNYNTGLRINYNVGNYAVVHHCLIRNFGVPDYNYRGITVGDYVYCKIYNNILVRSYVLVSNTSNSARWVYFYNNTLYDCHVYAGNDGVTRAKNNVAYRTDRDSFQGTFHADSDYNLSDDATAPGGNSLINKTLSDIDFVETTYDDSQDLHIKSTSDARDAGTDLSGDSDCPFSDDIDGDTRTGTWDIGADEYMNQPPDAPTGLGPTEYVDGSPGSNNTPTLEFTQSDPDGDDIRYQIQIIHDSYGMVTDYTSEPLPHPGATSFTVGQTAGDGGYTAGGEGQTLPDGDYYWQVRSRDEHDAWGPWSLAKGGDVAFQTDAITETGESTKDTYSPNEDVEVSAGGFPPGSDVNVYVVGDGKWLGGETIADYGIVVQKTFTADGDGEISGVIWEAPLEIGEYDVVFDANQNGIYDEITDSVYDPNHPGFIVVRGAVGGEVYPIDKAAILLPWLGLGAVLILAAGTTLALRRRLS